MLAKTKGIVIRTTKYGDSSAIVNIFTEQYGLLGFIIPAIYKNKGTIKTSHIQLLNVLELTFTYNSSKNLQRIKELHCIYHFYNQSFSQKATYTILSETLTQTLKNNEQNIALFNYLTQYQLPLLNTDGHFWQIPEAFINILQYYGCAPYSETYQENFQLDIQNGVFAYQIKNTTTKNIASQPISSCIYKLLKAELVNLPLNKQLRHQTIETLILYFQYHINETFGLRSREVLAEIVQ